MRVLHHRAAWRLLALVGLACILDTRRPMRWAQAQEEFWRARCVGQLQQAYGPDGAMAYCSCALEGLDARFSWEWVTDGRPPTDEDTRATHRIGDSCRARLGLAAEAPPDDPL